MVNFHVHIEKGMHCNLRSSYVKSKSTSWWGYSIHFVKSDMMLWFRCPFLTRSTSPAKTAWIFFSPVFCQNINWDGIIPAITHTARICNPLSLLFTFFASGMTRTWTIYSKIELTIGVNIDFEESWNNCQSTVSIKGSPPVRRPNVNTTLYIINHKNMARTNPWGMSHVVRYHVIPSFKSNSNWYPISLIQGFGHDLANCHVFSTMDP